MITTTTCEFYNPVKADGNPANRAEDNFNFKNVNCTTTQPDVLITQATSTQYTLTGGDILIATMLMIGFLVLGFFGFINLIFKGRVEATLRK
jgi:hypothetical protein